MKVEIIPAHVSHVPLILANLREHDKAVLTGAGDKMIEGIKTSRFAFSGFIDGEIACLWGIRVFTLLNDIVFLWVITTRAVEEHPFVFVRHSQILARRLLVEYPKITGWVATENEMSVKWLKWLGCELTPAEPGLLGFELKRA